MKSKRMLFMLTILLLLCVNSPVSVFAEKRNIYVGDIITLEITSQEYSEDELKQKFLDFEIVDIKKNQDGYLISIRTFDAGEYTILLGSKEIIIDVASTLTDIQREDIFEGVAEIKKPGGSFYLHIIFYIMAGVFLLSSGFSIVKVLIKRKNKSADPYQLFLKHSSSLLTDEDNYFVDLTFYFKEYLESICKFRIIGKTASEIVNELKEVPVLDTMLPDIEKWLTECDILKFAGITVSNDVKHSHYTWLLNIAEKINFIYENKQI